jgi:hypothetical protein
MSRPVMLSWRPSWQCQHAPSVSSCRNPDGASASKRKPPARLGPASARSQCLRTIRDYIVNEFAAGAFATGGPLPPIQSRSCCNVHIYYMIFHAPDNVIPDVNAQPRVEDTTVCCLKADLISAALPGYMRAGSFSARLAGQTCISRTDLSEPWRDLVTLFDGLVLTSLFGPARVSFSVFHGTGACISKRT